ncbi:MAG: hypothetical protein HC905_01420 [Bacteroidales bacterium]|nr:hypothetical protein [Bacteroidales bacterium]
MKAPEIDNFLLNVQNVPAHINVQCANIILNVFHALEEIEAQGDDEIRNVWLEADRGEISDFGSFSEYKTEGIIETEKEFVELWESYYPDKIKWYQMSITRYADTIYLYINSKITLQVDMNKVYPKEKFLIEKFAEWLLAKVNEVINKLKVNEKLYNRHIQQNLPFQKRFGKILREKYWMVSPDEMNYFKENLLPETISNLRKIVEISEKGKASLLIEKMTSGLFFRICEIGYNANNYFEQNGIHKTAKEKYLIMADGRDCNLSKIDEDSVVAFRNWYKNESHCGGHPWEICRGGNSTHISLFLEYIDNSKWLLRLAGRSSVRVVETIKFAVALFENEIPFMLEDARNILNMVTGVDYIGIVPDSVIPRYCSSYFPNDEHIIDFMNLGNERRNELVKIAVWYPEREIRLKTMINRNKIRNN